MAIKYNLCDLLAHLYTDKFNFPENSIKLIKNNEILDKAIKLESVSNLDCNLLVTGVNTLKSATNTELSFYTNTKYRIELIDSKAGCIITTDKYRESIPDNTIAIIVNNPHLAYAKIAELFHINGTNHNDSKFKPGIHSTAVIGENCAINSTVFIGPYVVIGDNVSIESNSVIKSGVVIEDNCAIGSNTVIHSRVVLYNNTIIKNNCVIHSGVIIGSDGFGFALTKDRSYEKVPQLGNVIIGNNVEIGANTTIDRGAIEDTVINDGVKLDNQIQIAHNVTIGSHTVIAAHFSIAGSVTIGKYCAFGGGGAVSGHVNVCDGVYLAGFSTVGKSIDKPGFYASGTGHVIPFNKWRRMTVYLKDLKKYIHTENECK